jgi:hypothetical protein
MEIREKGTNKDNRDNKASKGKLEERATKPMPMEASGTFLNNGARKREIQTAVGEAETMDH